MPASAVKAELANMDSLSSLLCLQNYDFESPQKCTVNNGERLNEYTEEMSVAACPGCTCCVTHVIIPVADYYFLSPHKKCEETTVRPQRHSHLTQGEMAIRRTPPRLL